jgi:hypothetical protein
MSASDEGARVLRERYTKILKDLSTKLRIENAVMVEATAKINILADKSVTLGGSPEAVVGGLIQFIESAKGMAGRSQKIAEALNLAAMTVNENARRLAVHLR